VAPAEPEAPATPAPAPPPAEDAAPRFDLIELRVIRSILARSLGD
jgi:hypothetical protein